MHAVQPVAGGPGLAGPLPEVLHPERRRRSDRSSRIFVPFFSVFSWTRVRGTLHYKTSKNDIPSRRNKFLVWKAVVKRRWAPSSLGWLFFLGELAPFFLLAFSRPA